MFWFKTTLHHIYMLFIFIQWINTRQVDCVAVYKPETRNGTKGYYCVWLFNFLTFGSRCFSGGICLCKRSGILHWMNEPLASCHPGSWSDPLVGFCRLQEEEMAGECGAMLTSSSVSHLVSPTVFRQRCCCRNVPLRGRRVSGCLFSDQSNKLGCNTKTRSFIFFISIYLSRKVGLVVSVHVNSVLKCLIL